MRKLGLGFVLLIITWVISMISGCESPTSSHKATDTPIAPPPVTPLLLMWTPTLTDTPVAPPLVCETPSVMPIPIPIPTDTPVAPPPAWPTTTPSVPPRAEVVVSALNVREGPGIDYPIIGAASAGDAFQIVGVNPSGDWLKVVTADGSLGWISGHPTYTRVLGSLDGVPVAQLPPPPRTATPIAPPPPKPQYQYCLARSVTCTPNCGSTGIKGVVYDVNAIPMPGLIVKVWTDEWCCGKDATPTYGPYEIMLSAGAKGGRWYVAVYSHDGSTQLSEVVEVDTDWEPCEPFSGGCQWPVVDFVARW